MAKPRRHGFCTRQHVTELDQGVKERFEADLARMDDGPRPKQDDRFEGGSTQKLVLQLNWALYKW